MSIKMLISGGIYKLCHLEAMIDRYLEHRV